MLLFRKMEKGRFRIPFSIAFTGLLILVVDRYFLGGMIFWVRYGNIDSLQLVWANVFYRPLETITNLGYSLFDPEAGLLFRAPWVIAAVPGLINLKSESPVRFTKLVIPSICYLTSHLFNVKVDYFLLFVTCKRY